MFKSLTELLADLFAAEERSPVVDSALSVLARKLVVDTNPGFCLRLVRNVVEDAFTLPSRALYSGLVIPELHRMGVRPDGDPHYYWASGAEAAMRGAGLVRVGDPEPGDLLFAGKVSKPYGHVGILIDGGLVLENTWANRGWRMPSMGAVRLTHLNEFDKVTTTISWQRLRDRLVK